ncbi:hypothetical protein ScPMuIL_008489 [Solemya velum]
MEPLHKKAITKCRVQLIEDMIVEDLLDRLEQEEVFPVGIVERINAGETRREKARRILDDLMRRGPTAFDKFVQCLRDSQQGFLADKLVEQEGELRRENLGNLRHPTEETSSQIIAHPSDYHRMAGTNHRMDVD